MSVLRRSNLVVGLSIPVIMLCVAYMASTVLGLSTFDALTTGLLVSLTLVVAHLSTASRADLAGLRGEVGELQARMEMIGRALVESESRRGALDESMRRLATDSGVAGAADVDTLGSLLGELAEAVAAHDFAIAQLRDGGRIESGPAGGVTTADPAAQASVKGADAAKPARLPRTLDAQKLAQARLAARGAGVATRPPADAPSAEAQPKPQPDVPPAEAAGLAANATPVTKVETVAIARDERRDAPIAGPPITPAARLIRDAVAADDLELFLQPIVTLPQRKSRLYEAMLRPGAPGGEAVSSLEMRSAAASAGLSAQLDLALLGRVIRLLVIFQRRGRDTTILLVASSTSLSDPRVAGALRAFLVAEPALAGNLVLGLTQSGLRSAGPVETALMEEFAASGLRFAMVDTKDLRLDAASLAARGVRYARLPAARLAQAAQEEAGALDIDIADLAGMLGRHGVDLVADGVSSEQFVLDLLDFSVPLAQGELFAAPRQVRPELFELAAAVTADAPAPAATPASAAVATVEPEPALDTAAPAQAAEQRISFRSLLRRA